MCNKSKHGRLFAIVTLSSIFITVTLFSCGSKPWTQRGVPQERKNTHEVSAIPAAFMIETPNRFDYQPNYECSAFASAYILRHYGEEADGLSLFESFPGKMSDGGVMPSGLVTFFKSRGYETEYICDGTVDELKAEIAKGVPIIVFIHVEEPYTNPHYTHYIPAVGYDEEYIYFAESLDYLANHKDVPGAPYNRRTEIPKFERLWRNIDGMWDYPWFRITAKEIP